MRKALVPACPQAIPDLWGAETTGPGLGDRGAPELPGRNEGELAIRVTPMKRVPELARIGKVTFWSARWTLLVDFADQNGVRRLCG
ncbi:MAG TPA: hypothetical protein VID93_07155, partial [Acidimicrobiales bacterium]